MASGIAEHRFIVIHKSGVLHVDADALSRCPLRYPEEEAERVCVTVRHGEVNRFDLGSLHREQEADADVRRIYDELCDDPNSALAADI